MFCPLFQCIHISGRGFTVGSYKCVCRDGYYHPNSNTQAFNGTVIEHAFSNNTLSFNPELFACKRCRKGCITCIDDRPCIVETNYIIRYSILGVTLLSIVLCLGVTIFVWRCREIQVILYALFYIHNVT